MNKNNRIRLANQVVANNALIAQLEQVDFDANPYVKELIERLSKVNTYLLHDVFKLLTLDERLSEGIDHIRQYTSADGLENLKLNKVMHDDGKGTTEFLNAILYSVNDIIKDTLERTKY